MAKIKISFEVNGQKAVLDATNQQIKALEQQGVAYQKVADDATASSNEQVTANEQVAKSYNDILKEYRANVKELNALAIAGEQNSERFQELQQTVAAAKDALADNARQVKANQSAFDATIGSIGGVASGFSAAQGAIGLFGAESEDVQKALLKVQSALALAQGLEGLQDAKESFTSLGNIIKGPIVKSFGSLRGAIISTGIGALVVALGLIIANFDKIKDVVLNLFPGLAGIGNAIKNIITAVTDFIGVTDSASDSLVNYSDRLKQARQDALDFAEAAGKSEQEIFQLTFDNNKKRIEDLKKIKEQRGKLTEEETQELLDLQKKQIKLVLENGRRLNDQQKKLKDDSEKAAIKAREDEAKANEDASKKRLEKQKEDAQKRLEAERTDAERRISLIKDDQDRELAERALKYKEEQRLAKQNGENLKALEDAYLQDINDINQKYFEKRADLLQKYADAQKKTNEEIGKINEQILNQQTENEIKALEDRAKQLQDTDKLTSDQIIANLKELNNIRNEIARQQSEKEKVDIEKQYQDRLKTIQSAFDEEVKAAEAAGQDTTAIREKQATEEAKVLKDKNDQIAQADKDLNNTLQENAKTTTKAIADETQKRTEKLLSDIEAITSKAFEIIGQFVEAANKSYEIQLQNSDRNFNRQVELLNRQREIETSNQQLTNEERLAINEDYAIKEAKILEKQREEQRRIQKRQANLNLAIQVAEIIASTALAISRANSAPPFPPLNLPFVIQAAATGAAQLAAAVAQRAAINKLEKGGLLVGPSHAQGGIMIPNTGIEVEGGEAVINKRSTAMFGGLLSAINQAGGGRPLTPNYTAASSFAGGGIVDTQAISSAVESGIIRGTAQTRDIVRAYIVQSEVDSNIARSSRIKRQATF